MNRFSGKFVLRVNPELHQTLRQKAKELKQSLNTTCAQLLKSALQNQKNSVSNPRLEFITKKTKKVFKNHLIGIVLFGSVVKKTTFATSDIDLLVVMKPSCKLSRQLYQTWDSKIDDQKEPIINPHFVNLPHNKHMSSLWLEVAKNHKIIWQKDKRLGLTLKEIQDSIFSGKVKAQESHGHPYWIWESNA